MTTKDIKKAVDRSDHLALMEKLLGMQLKPGKLIRSPLREKDNTPSFNVFKGNDGKVRWKDFAVEGGDIYHLVMYLKGCTFNEAVKILGDLIQFDTLVDWTPKERFRIPEKPREPTRISVVRRSWSKADVEYWEHNYGIGWGTAQWNGLYPCLSAQVDNHERPPWTIMHSELNPLYYYEINGHIKLYRPLNPDRKFKYMGNTTRDDVFIAGPNNRIWPTLITAGQKDALVAANEFDCNTRAFNSEAITPTAAQMIEILKSSSKVFACYDNDATGRKMMAKLVSVHPYVQPIELGTFTTLKDIADVRSAQQFDVLRQIKDIIHGE